jgi:hypothetical protein
MVVTEMTKIFKHWTIGWHWFGRAIESGLFLWTLDENDTKGIEVTKDYFFMTMNHLHTCKFPDLKK